ncbi:MAG: aldo/keto reductase [Chloroflexota bacterium]|nr:aldo/keto reductase [Chloroflexota bacterium]MDE2885232.1 aldo/keto reductase [Chloroflexota bacterium]
MRYRTMGATGIRVSEIGFGSGDNAGLLVKGEPDVQLRAIERALELGINYFDTSPDYGKGLAEENIGKAMKAIGFRPVLATKVEIMPDELDHIAEAVIESLEDSLRRLQVDHVDVLQIHNPPSIETDTTVPGWLHLGLDDYLGPGGALEGMERLRRAGKTRFFGFANEDADADAVMALMETGEFHMLNVWYDLLNPTAGLPTPDGLDVQHDYGQFLRRAQELGIGTATIRPLGGGVLTDHAVSGGGRHALAGGGLSRNADMYQAMVERAKPFAFLSRSGQTLSQAAYRFILQDEAVTTVLGGFSEMAHLEEAAGCSGAPPLSDEDMARLDMVWRSNVGKWDTEEQFISGL